jgi:hypothetical protein
MKYGIIVPIILITLSMIVTTAYYIVENNRLRSDLRQYSDFGVRLDEALGNRTHVDQWNEMGPWYFKKYYVDDKYGSAYMIRDKMGLRVVTDYDIKQITQYCK